MPDNGNIVRMSGAARRREIDKEICMAEHASTPPPAIRLATSPELYKHWKLTVDGEVATLAMDVDEEGGLGSYVLKQNSYDLGVDIELFDAVERLRFQHPEVKSVVVTGLKDKVFCSGANIFMLGSSSHAFKVNFCKFTNETRLGIEDASEHSGIKFLAALNGTAAGGGYELALACDDILLLDDASSAVSFPEVPLLGVLPGTGGLTRITDKRKVRRDLCDVFSTVAEGVKGKRAVEWKLVDALAPKSAWADTVKTRALALAAKSRRPGMAARGQGLVLDAIEPVIDGTSFTYKYVTLLVDPKKRTAEITLRAPAQKEPASGETMLQKGNDLWALRCYRELDDAILRLRLQFLEVGLITLKTEGDPTFLLDFEKNLLASQEHWFAREVLFKVKRVLKRLDVTSRTFLALVEPGSCFAGSFAELLLIADRSYMLDDSEAEKPAQVIFTSLSDGPLPMGNGLTRLQTRFWGDEAALARLKPYLAEQKPIGTEQAEKLGVVTFVRDEIDYPDEVRLFVEERTALSPDALTGMEANLRWPGPETMETRIFGRLSAWQNWIFIRENATGPKGALTSYGKPERPSFDMRRT
jgi:benzoyl-CoA-dihydrodiol lyase